MKIEPGQKWRSKDKRERGRIVTVEQGTTDPAGFVVVRSARLSTLRARTLIQRYELVKDDR